MHIYIHVLYNCNSMSYVFKKKGHVDLLGLKGVLLCAAFPLFCVTFSSAFPSKAFIKHWVVALSLIGLFLNEFRQRIQRVIYQQQFFL